MPIDQQQAPNSQEQNDPWWCDGLKKALALPDTVQMVGMPGPLAAPQIEALKPILPASLLRASIKRQIDYLAGRHCAALALQAAGCDGAVPPAMGEDRLPQWPAGWLGSITHSGGEVLAAASRIDASRLLGIDVESLIEPAAVEGIAALVALDGELDALSTLFSGCSPSQALTLLFSAKESLYKALYPDTQRFMDFSAARAVAFAPGALTLKLTEDWHPLWPAGSLLVVRYAMRDRRVYTALYLARSRP